VVGKRLHVGTQTAKPSRRSNMVPRRRNTSHLQCKIAFRSRGTAYVSQQGLGCDRLVIPPLSCLVREGGIACMYL
jgi:hypothetical protein